MEWKPVSIFVMVVAALAAMALGDYLGYKFHPGRIGMYLGIAALAVIVVFAIYAAVVLA
jgi:hypothetical protein